MEIQIRITKHEIEVYSPLGGWEWSSLCPDNLTVYDEDGGDRLAILSPNSQRRSLGRTLGEVIAEFIPLLDAEAEEVRRSWREERS